MLQARTRPSGLHRVAKAFSYSVAGLRACWQKEAAFRQEAVFAVFMIPGSFWLGSNAVERALLIGSVLLVLIIELVNSAIEAVVDRVSTDRHRLSGLAKDLGSAAVLLSLAIVWVVWGLIAWERFGRGLPTSADL